ncbi:MAG: hypothetical protein JWO38_7778 [Gemmataceae bacterium]|nr:hypothetical protein [Gemmataceae bacterium]
MLCLRSLAPLIAVGFFSPVPALRAAPPPDAAGFFEKKVRPILAERCLVCHGPDKQKGGLRLDSRAAVLAGGERGAAVVPGKPEESSLVRAVRHGDELKMPPKDKLPDAEIAALAEWVRLGAPWPDSQVQANPTPKTGDRPFTPEEKAFWAFQPVRRSDPPRVKAAAWCRTPIDHFVLAKLEAAGFTPALEADKLTLLRRVTFDLTGLLPTPGEVDAFLADTSPNAWEKVVDQLLASPAYGEKWGRRWLDVARYADSNGMDENLAHANAWRYRDWVIRSFNGDMPYDRFVREQIAGDLIPGGTDRDRADRLTATGFLVVGPKMLAEDDPVKMRMDIIDEQVDTIGQAVLGLTLGCARCHDHKFDPVRTADYYGLAGIFYSTKTMRSYGVVAQWHERSVATPEQAAALAAHEKVVAAAKAVAAARQRPALDAVAGAAVGTADRTRLQNQVAKLEKARPPAAETMAVEDDKGQNVRVHLRGNHLTLGAEAPRRFPRIIAGDAPPSLGADRSGRLEFAEWVTRPDHPLTPRVMANRIWAGHFGAGLVRSPDNFGRLGERPTHPELLDWLADEFVRAKWSVKHLHRVIVNSAVYRMSSSAERGGRSAESRTTIFGLSVPRSAFRDPRLLDPENKLLSHFNRRRLDAEEVRDAMLATAGLLDRTAGGTLLTVGNRQYVTVHRNYEGYASTRRSVYLPVVRSAVFDVLQTLDFPDPSVPNGQRPTTTVPTQALLMLNSALADQTAGAFAKSLLAPGGDDAGRVREAYRRAYGRAPTTLEVEKVTAYLEKSERAADPKSSPEVRRLKAWRGFCRVLLASNEFVFVE